MYGLQQSIDKPSYLYVIATDYVLIHLQFYISYFFFFFKIN